jgi:hypothetical protein
VNAVLKCADWIAFWLKISPEDVVEVLNQLKVPLKDIAEVSGAPSKTIKLKTGKLTKLDEGLYARMTDDGKIEIFEEPSAPSETERR